MARKHSVDLFLLVYRKRTRAHIDKENESTDDRQDLEEIVFGKIPLGMVRVKLRSRQLDILGLKGFPHAGNTGYTHGPEVVDQNIEDAQDDDQ